MWNNFSVMISSYSFVKKSLPLCISASPTPTGKASSLLRFYEAKTSGQLVSTKRIGPLLTFSPEVPGKTPPEFPNYIPPPEYIPNVPQEVPLPAPGVPDFDPTLADDPPPLSPRPGPEFPGPSVPEGPRPPMPSPPGPNIPKPPMPSTPGPDIPPKGPPDVFPPELSRLQ